MSNTVISFIVDADIARSSGFSENPVSSGSRKFLENLAKNGHKIAMCQNLRKEWRKHKSLYATKWMTSMVAKKKIIFICPPELIKKYIENNIIDGREKEVALKDSHLIDAALVMDKIIVSNDNTARNVFCSYSSKRGEIGEIMWFGAVSDSEFISETLMSGGHVPEIYYLGAKNKL